MDNEIKNQELIEALKSFRKLSIISAVLYWTLLFSWVGWIMQIFLIIKTFSIKEYGSSKYTTYLTLSILGLFYFGFVTTIANAVISKKEIEDNQNLGSETNY